MKKILSILSAFLLTMTLTMPVYAASAASSTDKESTMQELHLIAHRGCAEMAPGNTLAAFRLAGENGYWGAECDILQTADGVWVVCHDRNIVRTTNGWGKISQLTYDEIARYHVDKGNNIEQYPDEKIPTLTQYLDVCKEYGMHPVIEIKYSSPDQMQSLCDLLSAREEKDRFIVVSFFRRTLATLKALMPDTQMYLLSHSSYQKVIDDCLEDGLDGLCTSHESTDEGIQLAQKAGLRLIVWTVDTERSAQRLYRLGVTDMITNKLIPASPANGTDSSDTLTEPSEQPAPSESAPKTKPVSDSDIPAAHQGLWERFRQWLRNLFNR